MIKKVQQSLYSISVVVERAASGTQHVEIPEALKGPDSLHEHVQGSQYWHDHLKNSSVLHQISSCKQRKRKSGSVFIRFKS